MRGGRRIMGLYMWAWKKIKSRRAIKHIDSVIDNREERKRSLYGNCVDCESGGKNE